MPFNKEKIAWHEKSVEYQFIIDGAGGNAFDIAWPLDGNEEKAGDTVFRTDYNYYIVEFKGDLAAFDKEYVKYAADGKDAAAGKTEYLVAKQALAASGASCHFIVCGDVEGAGQDARFALRRYRYFDCDSSGPAALTDRIAGVSCDDMQNYLSEYAPYKKGQLEAFDDASGEEGSGGGVANRARSLLVGINANTGKQRAWDLKECLRFELNKKPSVTNTNTSKKSTKFKK